MGIPINPGMTEDSQSWVWTKNGEFSVKSAYRVALKVLKEKKMSDGGECSDSVQMKKMWKKIWSLNCPSKIKHFLGRSSKNILPINHCLKIRKLAVKENCVFCGERKTSGHTLWGCKTAIDVWKESGIKLPNGILPQGEFIDLVWNLMEKPDDFDWELFATTAWCVWKNRNEMKFEGRSKQAKSIALEASRYVEEFR